MDKLSLISGALFLAADIFAVAALAMPDWIVTEVGGDTRLGLMQVVSLTIKLKLTSRPSDVYNYSKLLNYCYIGPQQIFSADMYHIALHINMCIISGNLIPN